MKLSVEEESLLVTLATLLDEGGPDDKLVAEKFRSIKEAGELKEGDLKMADRSAVWSRVNAMDKAASEQYQRTQWKTVMKMLKRLLKD